MEQVKCEYCKNHFLKHRCAIKRTKLNYCSLDCYRKDGSKNTGFPKDQKNPKGSQIRKDLFKQGLLNVSGKNNGMYGKKHSIKSKNKIGESNKKWIHPKLSKETKRKIREGHLGNKLSKEHKAKIGLKGKANPMYGVKHNQESINKIKKARANQKNCYTTKIELKIQRYLKDLGIDFFIHYYIKDIKHGYQCDIFIPSRNLVIECDGDYWHKYPIGKEIDFIRTKELIEKGFNVLRLWEREINTMNINQFKNKLDVTV